MIQLPTESATYARWQLEQQVKRLEKDRDAARRRGVANVVATPAENYLANALEQAAATLRKAAQGINPTMKETA